MPHKGPHISISPDYVVNRILRINRNDFEEWPEAVRRLAIEIAEELFLVAYNPFIDAATVRQSVQARFSGESLSLAHHYATSIGEGITMFWSTHEAEQAFRQELIKALQDILPDECILTRAGALVENATDATDLRMELPLLVVEPDTTEQVAELVKLANDKKFALIPRGGGSGMTGGAVPARKRTLIVSLTRLTRISPPDLEDMSLSCQAGVITQDAIKAASAAGVFFSVDPASKQASSIGGNVAENAGGPCAFEYGTTLDNLLWWRMVTPTGEIITVERENHPRHKIMPDESATYVVKDVSGGVRNVVQLRGDEIRLPGLGKDVTNKALGGLPGMQKEGVDGIITEACFVLHPKPRHSRVLVLEFFGRSMHTAAVVIRELVALRNRIREEGDYARLSALEEFNAKYVQAIEYKRKSDKYEGDPISVIVLQVDGDEPFLLEKCVQEIVKVVEQQENVDVHVARDAKEAELFWEDRHKLSAIAKRTSGFKINEDVVIPMESIPDFALFLEQLNLECAASALRRALQAVGRLPGFPMEDKEFNREFSFASKAAQGGLSAQDFSDEELHMRAVLFLNDLVSKYPHLERKIGRIREYMLASRIIVASHMHAGDGNCHVNIPVNSNDHDMMEEAEHVAARVMSQTQSMGGEVSGEHGIGITKIGFLSKEKMDALREFKERVDPRDIMNPAKLVHKELPVRPFTFSFNRLINDIRESGLPGKDELIGLLASVQGCTRCGKCKHVCSMTYPERSFQYHPRNKNMVLGMLLEALYYSQVNKGRMDAGLLAQLRGMVEHCTGCGRCTANCPVKIPSAEVALTLRAVLEHENAGGHPVKKRALDWLSKESAMRVPKAAKMASLGQKIQNNVLGFVPEMWKKRLQNPLFSGKGPKIGYTNLYESLKLHRGAFFSPVPPALADTENKPPVVLYFPGCGGSLFYDRIGMASVFLLLKAGFAVVIPRPHSCCGYPLLSAGMDAAFARNREQLRASLAKTVKDVRAAGYALEYCVTACGSCRDGLERLELPSLVSEGGPLLQQDVLQLTLPRLALESPTFATSVQGENIIYHASCHAEWAGVHTIKGQNMLAQALSDFTGAKVKLSPGCCGESGMGAMTSPHIYNVLRSRKSQNLHELSAHYDGPIVVGCPSCKVGIGRILLALQDKRPVLHSTEWLAALLNGPDWRHAFRKKVNESKGDVRVVTL